MDPQLTEDGGGAYAQKKFRELAREKYIISKHTNTPYQSVNDLTPTERRYILEFITDDLQRQNDAYEKAKNKKNNS